MSKASDWYPSKRQEQVDLVRIWISVFNETAKGSAGGSGTGGASVTKRAAWGIPDETFIELTTAWDEAQGALAVSKAEETRTAVSNARCKAAFAKLDKIARDVKRRYFFVPPLDDGDLVSLGLRPKDETPTPAGTPVDQAVVKVFLTGPHELGVRIEYVTGSADSPANKGYRIWYAVVPAGAEPPKSPEDLTKSFYTKRKRDIITFDFGDSGKTAHFAVQIENESGKKGPWGPMVSAVIP
jgi:hypothetical protein